jgi:hypothetical protein
VNNTISIIILISNLTELINRSCEFCSGPIVTTCVNMLTLSID